MTDVTTTRANPTSISFDMSLRSERVRAGSLNSFTLKKPPVEFLGKTATRNLTHASQGLKGAGEDVLDGDEEQDEEGDAPLERLGVIELDLDFVVEGVLDLDTVVVGVAVGVGDGEAPIEREGVGEEEAVIDGVADDVGDIVGVGEGEHVELGDAPSESEEVGEGVSVVEGVIEGDVVKEGVTEGVGVTEGKLNRLGLKLGVGDGVGDGVGVGERVVKGIAIIDSFELDDEDRDNCRISFSEIDLLNSRISLI